jgi:hypothetical protein
MFTFTGATNNTVSIIRLLSISGNIVYPLLTSIIKNKIVPSIVTMHKDRHSFKVWAFGSSSIAYQFGERVPIIAYFCTAADRCD